MTSAATALIVACCAASEKANVDGLHSGGTNPVLIPYDDFGDETLFPATRLKICLFRSCVQNDRYHSAGDKQVIVSRLSIGKLDGVRRPIHLHRIPCSKGGGGLELAGKNASCAVQPRQSVEPPRCRPAVGQGVDADGVQQGLVDRRSGLRGLVCPGHGIDAGLSLHRQELHPPGVGGHPIFDVGCHSKFLP